MFNMTRNKQVPFVFLLLASLLLSHAKISPTQAESLEEEEFVVSPTEELDKFIELESKSALSDVDSSDRNEKCGSGLYKYMDKLAVSLKNAISKDAKPGSPDLLGELKGAINMVDFLKAAPKASGMISINVKAPRYAPKASSMGLGLILSGANNGSEEEHVVHAKMDISDEALNEIIEFSRSGQVSAKRFMELYSDPRWNKSKNLNASGANIKLASLLRCQRIQSIKNFLINGFESSASMVESFYMMPAFVEQIPVIGRQVKVLKKSGQGVYDIIQTIRSFKSFLENYHNGRKLEVNLTAEGKQMVSKVGVDALMYVALNMFKSFSGIEITPRSVFETANRAAYYLLVQFLPHAADCINSREGNQ